MIINPYIFGVIPQASNLIVTAATDTTLTLSWTRGNRSAVLVVAKQAFAVDTNPSDNTTYTPSATFGSGTQIGTGNYTVYNGTGTSVTITGLTANTFYSFRAYEFNGGAGSESYLTTKLSTNPISEYTFTTEYQTYNDRLTTLGYTKPSIFSAQIARNRKVRIDKADSVWATKDGVWNFIGAGSQEAACVNIKTPASFEASRVSSPTFSDFIGFTSNGSSSYVNLNFTPSTNGVAYTQNDASLICYFSSEGQSGNSAIANLSNTTRRILLAPRNTSDQTSIFINDNTVSQPSNTRSKGFFHAFRSGASSKSLYKNNASLLSGAGIASTGLTTVSLYLGCRNNAGVADSFWAGSFGCFEIGSSMSSNMSQVFTNYMIYLIDIYVALESTLDRIGELFFDDFARASLGANYATDGSATWGANGSNGTVSGGANVYTYRLRRVYPNSFDRWDQRITITIGAAPSTNYGHGLGFSDYSSPDVEQTVLMRFDMSNGANVGKLYIYTYDGSTATQRAVSAGALSVANGDTFRLRFRKHYVNGYFIYAAEVLKSDLTTVRVAWTMNTVIESVTLSESTGDFAQFTFGGTYAFSDWRTMVYDQKNVETLFVGDSITKGYAATDMSTNWARQVGNSIGLPYELCAGSGDITQRFLDKVPSIIAQRPSQVIVMIGGNDILLGVAQATREANFTSAVTQLEAEGIVVIICKATPRTPTDVTGWNTFLATFAGNLVIDTYTPLVGSGTSLNAIYDGGGGVHPNQAGMDLIASTVIAAL